MANLTITGSAYTCISDLANINTLKATLDYHTKYFGNAIKSTATATDLKNMQADYDTAKSKYDSSVCGKDPEMDKCLQYQTQISSLRSTIIYFTNTGDVEQAGALQGQLDDLQKKFNDSKCSDKVSSYKAVEITSVTDVFSQMDKARIETDSKYQRNQRIFFGAIVLFGAVIMVSVFRKNK